MDVLKQIEGIGNPIILGVFVFICLFLLVRIINSVRDRRLIKTVTSLNRGTKSERNLVLRLLKIGIPAQTIFHDLVIKKSNGKFSQIDIVVVTVQGIIVFEVKDYSGWIFGDGNYSHWTKVLAYGKKKYRFYNPIKQNNGHINALKKQSKQFDRVPFFSVVVFYGDCELKEINYVPDGTFIAKSKRVIEVFNLIKKNNIPAHYTNREEVIMILQNAVVEGAILENHQKHKEDIKDMLGKHRIFE